MKVFGTVDTFIEGASRDLRLGRFVANATFMRALLEHSGFDAFHLFCPSTSHRRHLERILRQEMPGIIERRGIAFSTHLEVPKALGTTRYAAFHVGGWGLFLPRLAYVRQAVDGPSFPLTGVTHSLHTADIFPKMREVVAAPFDEGDAIVCTTEAGRQVMRNHYAEAVRRHVARGFPPPPSPLHLARIPLGVDERCFALPDRAACRQELGLGSEQTCLLYIGRLSPQTKADLVPLLYTFARLRRRGPACEAAVLVLAGGGEPDTQEALVAAVRELGLADQVRVVSNVSDEAKLKLLAAADVFVSPVDNHQETFGLSIVEAMAAGLPVVASDFDGYRELIVEAKTGFRIPTYGGRLPEAVARMVGVLDPNLTGFFMAQTVAVDVGALLQALERLVLAPELRQRLGQAGRRRAEAEYRWPALIAAYESLWAELASAKNGRAASGGQRSGAGEAGDPYLGDLHAIFGHYATANLEPQDRFRGTELLAEVLAGRVPVPAVYQDLDQVVDAELGSFLLNFIAGAGSPTMATCTQAARDKRGADPSVAAFQLTWLLKQGLIERLSPED